MTGLPIVTPFAALKNWLLARCSSRKRPDLHALWLHPETLPPWVADSPPVRRTLDLLGPLHWERFPERDLQRNWGQTTVPYAAFTAAYLVKLNESRVFMSDLREYLVEHPGFKGKQPQSLRRRPLQQDATASRRPGLQTRVQTPPQSTYCAAPHTLAQPAACRHCGCRRVLLGVWLRRRRHQGPRLG